MGNIIGNAISSGGPTYTGTPGARLNWLWSSPLFTAWMALLVAVRLVWLLMRTVIDAFVRTLQLITAVGVNYRVILWWLAWLALLWWVWFVHPSLMDALDIIWDQGNQLTITAIFFINMTLDLYGITVVVWNSIYPLIGFVLYIFLDVLFAWWIEIIKILGEPALGKFFQIYCETLFTWQAQLLIAFLTPLMRFMPSIMLAFTAQVGPIVQIVMSVTPFIFPIVSWTFGKLFFVLEPSLDLVIWAVKKVQKFFGRSVRVRNVARGVTLGLALSRQLFDVFESPQERAVAAAAAATTLEGQARLNALDQSMRDASLQAAAAATLSTTTSSVRHDSEASTGHGSHHARFDEPQHAVPDVEVPESHEQQVAYDETNAWNQAGATGSRYASSGGMSYAQGKRELAEINGFLVTHPQQSFDLLSQADAAFMDSIGAAATASQRRSTLSTDETIDVRAWFSASFSNEHNETTFAHVRGQPLDELQTAAYQEWLARACYDEAYAGGGGSNARPTDCPPLPSDEDETDAAERHADAHHTRQHLLRKATALGVPEHLQRTRHLNHADVERRHKRLQRAAQTLTPREVHAAIERDIVMGVHAQCVGSVHCGGEGAPMAHPRHAVRERYEEHVNVLRHADDDTYDMQRMKNRHLLLDANQHAANVALGRYSDKHAKRAHTSIEHHATVLLRSFTGMDDLTTAIDHYSTQYSSFHDVQHKLSYRFNNRTWLEHLWTRDASTSERRPYHQWAREQRFHVLLEADHTHGHLAPVVYVELHGSEFTRLERDLLYTLPLFAFLNDLDCYTTNPRAPLCLPDPFPDNTHLSDAWLPVPRPFKDVDSRCFCAQYFCEQPRLLGKVFPRSGAWLVNLWYFVGPCRWYNAGVFVVLIFQYVFEAGFLALSVFIARYPLTKPVLSWMFIVPAGRHPSVRVFMCMSAHLYDVFAVAFEMWFFFGLTGAYVWLWGKEFNSKLLEWVATTRSYVAVRWQRVESSLESSLYHEAYDTSLNTGMRDYNDPERNRLGSNGVPRSSYAVFDDERDPFARPPSVPGSAAADELQQMGVGGGRLPHLVDHPARRTRYEQTREDNLYQLSPDQYEFKPQPDYTDAVSEQVLPLMQQRIGARASDDSDATATMTGAEHTSDALLAAMNACEAFYGTPWLRVTPGRYAVFERFAGWLLTSHHFSELWQRQMRARRQRMQHELAHETPIVGPLRR